MSFELFINPSMTEDGEVDLDDEDAAAFYLAPNVLWWGFCDWVRENDGDRGPMGDLIGEVVASDASAVADWIRRTLKGSPPRMTGSA